MRTDRYAVGDQVRFDPKYGATSFHALFPNGAKVAAVHEVPVDQIESVGHTQWLEIQGTPMWQHYEEGRISGAYFLRTEARKKSMEQSGINHHIHCRLNILFGEEIEIERGSLHRRYEVNKYDLDFTHRDRDPERLKANRTSLIEDLIASGWARCPTDRHAGRLERVEGDKVFYLHIEDVSPGWNPKFCSSVFAYARTNVPPPAMVRR